MMTPINPFKLLSQCLKTNLYLSSKSLSQLFKPLLPYQLISESSLPAMLRFLQSHPGAFDIVYKEALGRLVRLLSIGLQSGLNVEECCFYVTLFS